MGREAAIELTIGGNKVGVINAAFADGKMSSPWFRQNGFDSPVELTLSGGTKSNRRPIYAIDITNARGDRLTMSMTLNNKKNGGDLSGTLSITTATGSMKSGSILAEHVIR
ncbi:MAG: hypothetical protein PF961_21440 [Planctomycetota bacterium]|jgi:hypothetical protein|nr:hypothetical protein [Planctomycetota bacterium]